jgi:Lamin Tail Domain
VPVSIVTASRAALLAVGVAGCYNPNLGNPGFYCHPEDHPACPGNQVCSDGRCVDPTQALELDGGLDLAVGPGSDGGGGGDLARPKADLSDRDLATGGCTLTLNEVQTGGNAGAQDEFIELYNSCASARALSGYKIVYRSASGTTDVDILTFSTVSAPAHGYLVCGQTNYSGTADVTYSASGMAAAGGGLALLDGSGATIDSLGYGSATNAFVRGSPAPAPASAQSIERIPDGHDSGNNSADFSIGAAPTPGAANK